MVVLEEVVEALGPSPVALVRLQIVYTVIRQISAHYLSTLITTDSNWYLLAVVGVRINCQTEVPCSSIGN